MFLLKKLLAAMILLSSGLAFPALFGLWLTRVRSRRWWYGGLWMVTLSLLGLIVLVAPIAGTEPTL